MLSHISIQTSIIQQSSSLPDFALFLDELPEFYSSFFSRSTAAVAGEVPPLRYLWLLRESSAEKQEIHNRVFIAPRQPLANLLSRDFTQAATVIPVFR